MEVGRDWQDLLLSLLCWRREGPRDNPDDFPHLTKDEWRAWAARQYSSALDQSRAVPFPSKDHREHGGVWLVNEKHRDDLNRRVRLIAGALSHRALSLGWRDIGQRWADRYWNMAEKLDPEADLEKMSTELGKLESIARAPGVLIH